MSTTEPHDASGAAAAAGPRLPVERGVPPARTRDQLVSGVLRATSRIVGQGALFSQMVAERLGLAPTDVECFELLAESGRVTAGRLSELTGLTSGATTRMIDRMEQAGYVRRVADPADRRRVLVEAVPERGTAIGQHYASLARSTEVMVARYPDQDLAMIVDYLERSVQVTRDEITHLRDGAADDAGGASSHAAPVGPTTTARLIFLTGVPNLELRSDPGLGPDLYRARFDGPVPRVRARGGIVTVHYGRFSWLDWRASVAGQNVQASLHWRRDRGEIALNPTIPWAIELRGGASKLIADLAGLRLTSFDLRGGANRVDVTLPRPDSVVPVRIRGGLSNASIRRPAGVAVHLSVRDAGRVIVDGRVIQRGGAVSADVPGATPSAGRFDIEVLGGANRVTVDVA